MQSKTPNEEISENRDDPLSEKRLKILTSELSDEMNGLSTPEPQYRPQHRRSMTPVVVLTLPRLSQEEIESLDEA